MQQINLGPIDLNLALNQALPGTGANVLTGIIDLQAIAPNSDAWRLGRFAIVFPSLPEQNVAANTITVALQAAPPSLLAGSSAIAPQTPPPGAFITPPVAQTLTVPGVAGNGSVANVYYMTAAFDPNGSPYQFYQFLITVGAINTLAENILIAWIDA